MTLFIGLMSGTSADGMDAALVEFRDGSAPQLRHACGISYPAAFAQQLRQAAVAPQLSAEQVMQLDRRIAEISVEAINQLLLQSNTPAAAISAIGSHGHTLRHIANDQQLSGSSWQIGDPGWIAEHSGISCIADFRRPGYCRRRTGCPSGTGLSPGLPGRQQAATNGAEYRWYCQSDGTWRTLTGL